MRRWWMQRWALGQQWSAIGTLLSSCVLGGCADNFCFGCTSPGDPVPMQAAFEVRQIRVFDPVTNREYATGCRVARQSDWSPAFPVRLPLGVTYAADVYTANVWSDTAPDTRSSADICAGQHIYDVHDYRDDPFCLQSYTSEILEAYAIDENGAPYDGTATSQQVGVRYVMTTAEYGEVEFSKTMTCSGPQPFSYWSVVP